MKLLESLSKLSIIEQRIEDQWGEIKAIDEEDIKHALVEIEGNSDRTVWAIYKRKQEIIYLKELRELIKIKEQQLDRFKSVCYMAIEQYGPVETPLTSMKLQTRKSESVLITNFTGCMREYPESVTVKTIDNIRTITISKTKLKEIWDEKNGDVQSYEVIKRESTFLSARVRRTRSKSDS